MDIDFRPLLWFFFAAGLVTGLVLVAIVKLAADHLSLGVH